MATVLHLLGREDASLPLSVIERQLAAGDEVQIALLRGGPPPGLPAGVVVRRVPAELSYSQLLDLIFAVEHVTTW